MKALFLHAALASCLLFFDLESYAQSKEAARRLDSMVFSHDTIMYARGVPISEGDFYKQVERFENMLSRGDSIKTVDDCIILVRLQNTIAIVQPLAKIPRLQDFFLTSSQRYVRQIQSKLQTCLGPFESLYSKKYDIMLGGSTARHQDFYSITGVVYQMDR